MFYVLDACLNCEYVSDSFDMADDWAKEQANERHMPALYVTYYDDTEAKMLGIFPNNHPGERHE